MIEKSVASRFYDRDSSAIPTRWVQMVRHTLKSLGPKVLASRMVSEYVQRLYAPAALSAARMSADGYACAKELAAWRARVLAAWPGVRVLYVDSQLHGDVQLGERLALRAEVALNGLSAEDVEVQAVYGSADTDDRLSDTEQLVLSLVESGEGACWFAGEIPLDRTGPFGYTVRILPKHAGLATPAELGVVAVA